MLRYLSRFGLLTLGIGLATMGLLGWQAEGFRWPSLPGGETALSLEPLYLLIIGIAIVPPTLWDIFQLEMQRAGSSDADAGEPPRATQQDHDSAAAAQALETDGLRHDDG